MFSPFMVGIRGCACCEQAQPRLQPYHDATSAPNKYRIAALFCFSDLLFAPRCCCCSVLCVRRGHSRGGPLDPTPPQNCLRRSRHYPLAQYVEFDRVIPSPARSYRINRLVTAAAPTARMRNLSTKATRGLGSNRLTTRSNMVPTHQMANT